MSLTRNQDDQDVSLLALDQYMRLVKWTPELTLEEEGQLLERVGRGKQEQLKPYPDRLVLEEAKQAYDRLVAGFQPLIIHIASTYRYRVRSMDVMDLIQEGNLGLLQAIDVNDTLANVVEGVQVISFDPMSDRLCALYPWDAHLV